MTDVSIVACRDYSPEVVREALIQVLAPFGGLAFVKPGMKIAIKANLVSYLKPEAAATTHPALLCELIKLLREAGATVTVGDSPGGLYNAPFVNHVYQGTGMREVLAVGGLLNQNFAQSEAHYPEAVIAKTFAYTSYLDEADAIINFCKLKTHGMMGMSAAAKNMFGVIPGTLKPEYHYKYPDPSDFARMLVDLDEYFKPVLSIVDAVVGMEGNGPTKGEPRSIGALIAGQSPHKVDMLCAAVIGLDTNAVPTLQAAKERGLIPEALSSLSIDGDPTAFFIPDYKNIGTRNSHLFASDSKSAVGRLTSSFLSRALRSVPTLGEGCTGCAKCHNICPAHAITMKGKKPHIDRNACIGCFCCQEFCPSGAMKVKRPLIARLLNHNT